jgi:hypothetical protein
MPPKKQAQRSVQDNLVEDVFIDNFQQEARLKGHAVVETHQGHLVRRHGCSEARPKTVFKNPLK